jgi:hypothetical protein
MKKPPLLGAKRRISDGGKRIVLVAGHGGITFGTEDR